MLTAAGSIVICFVLVALFIVVVGLWLIWAEFNSAGKQNEYTRYKHHGTRYNYA